MGEDPVIARDELRAMDMITYEAYLIQRRKVRAVEALLDAWDQLAREHREAALRDSDIERDWIADTFEARARQLRAALDS